MPRGPLVYLSYFLEIKWEPNGKYPVSLFSNGILFQFCVALLSFLAKVLQYWIPSRSYLRVSLYRLIEPVFFGQIFLFSLYFLSVADPRRRLTIPLSAGLAGFASGFPPDSLLMLWVEQRVAWYLVKKPGPRATLENLPPGF